MIYYLLIILFLSSCDDIGKGYKWQGDISPGFSRHYGTVGYDYGWGLSYSPYDEGIVIVGQKTPALAGDSDLWAIKTNKRGIMEWERSFGGDANDVGYDVISTQDGGFLFLGYTWSFGNSQQLYVIKTDIYGNKQWEKTFGGSMWDVGQSAIEISVAGGGGYVLSGYSNSPGISSGNTDVYLVKIDQAGELIWQKAYGNKAFPNHEWAYDIVETNDNGFIVVGARNRYSKGSLNGLIFRIDAAGDLIWEKEFMDENQINEKIHSIAKSTNGMYYLCSTINSIESPEIYKPKITKIDPAGNIDWQRIFNANGKVYHEFKATTTYTNEVVIVGTSSNESPSGVKEDAFMTKIDPNGNIMWTYPYGSADEDDWGWSVMETAEKNLVIVGSTKSFGSSLFDIYLVGTNQDGISQ